MTTDRQTISGNTCGCQYGAEIIALRRELAVMRSRVNVLTQSVDRLKEVLRDNDIAPMKLQKPIPEKYMPAILEICERHNVSLAMLIGPRRLQQIVDARFEAFSVLGKLGVSSKNIGRMFARDHTAVMHGIRRHRASIEAGDAL